MDKSKVYAEDVAFFKTSSSSPDTWTDRILKMIIKHGGHIVQEGYASQQGNAVFMIEFMLGSRPIRLCGRFFNPVHREMTVLARFRL